MKNYVLVACLLVLILTNLFAEIKNGYERDIYGFRLSLQSLKDMLLENEGLSWGEKRKIKNRIKELVSYITCYEMTDSLLRAFRTIAPDLYEEVNSLRDYNGRIIDIYVKFIAEEHARFHVPGLVSFRPHENDAHRCVSEYGEDTISVKVKLPGLALRILSHELGHLRYMVPNLQTYVRYYRTKYKTSVFDSPLGHGPGDPSGKMAYTYERRFRKSYARYLKRDDQSVAAPVVLFDPKRYDFLQRLQY